MIVRAALLATGLWTAPVQAQRAAAWPFAPGETLRYDVSLGALRIGNGSMTVIGNDTIRGRPAWHMRFAVRGGVLGLTVDDVLESWMDITTGSSLRFIQDFNELGRKRHRHFDLFPERRTYAREGQPEAPSVADPLDDGLFLYFVRTIPLEVGRSYEFNRYFIPDRNPVRLRVLRRERVTVPAGTFDCLVVQPIIKTRGIFSENGRAEIWLSDDARRIMVQMKSKLSFGSLNLYLRTVQPSSGTTSAGTRP